MRPAATSWDGRETEAADLSLTAPSPPRVLATACLRRLSVCHRFVWIHNTVPRLSFGAGVLPIDLRAPAATARQSSARKVYGQKSVKAYNHTKG
jgi:hypothetical protein